MRTMAIKLPQRASKYPFRRMQIGQSFLIKGVGADTINSFRTSACYAAGKMGNGVKFSIRKVKIKGKIAYRCWRVT